MYAQLEDMVQFFGRREVIALSDVDDTGEINEQIVNDALQATASEIDSYLAGRYKLPLKPAPRNLTRLACDIARYHMTGNERLETEAIRQRYKSAVDFLKLVARGEVTLGPTKDGDTPNPSGSVQFAPGQKVFGRDGPGAY